MDINKYIKKIRLLGSHRRSERTGKAIDLCRDIRQIAEREGVSTTHITNVYRQMQDSGIVNKDELLKFQMDVTNDWGKNIGLNSSIRINSSDDIDVEEFM